MKSDKNNASYVFGRGDTKIYTCRKKLQDKFEENPSFSDSENNRSMLSVLNFNDTRKILRESAERISKTFTNVRTTLGAFSQRFRTVTKRRQILEEGPMTPNCATPQTFSKRILGRTPTKLYSPFSIESPYNPTTTTISKR